MIIINEKQESIRRKIYEAIDDKTFNFLKSEVESELRNVIFKGARFKLDGKNTSGPFASFWCDVPLKSINSKLANSDITPEDVASIIKAHLKKCGYDVYQAQVFTDNVSIQARSDKRRGKDSVSGHMDIQIIYYPDFPGNAEVGVTLPYAVLKKNGII